MAGCLLYLMCDDLAGVMRKLEARQVPCSAVSQAEWGKRTTFRLPSGADIGLYQPSHPTAIGLAR
jgi:hypothetical protein